MQGWIQDLAKGADYGKCVEHKPIRGFGGPSRIQGNIPSGGIRG